MEELDENKESYCPVCYHCGITECCGIDKFLDSHVVGKTNCTHEDEIIQDIKDTYKTLQEESPINLTRNELKTLARWVIKIQHHRLADKRLITKILASAVK